MQNTANNGKVWIRYHWELQSKKICSKCFVIDHNDIKCMHTSHLLYLDTLTEEEYEEYLKNEADVYEGNDGETTYKDEMAIILEPSRNEDDSRQRKRMRNSELNNAPLINPHNIHVQPPSTSDNTNTTILENHNNSMLEANGSGANTAETTDHSQEQTMQVYPKLFKQVTLYGFITSFFYIFPVETIFIASLYFPPKMRIILVVAMVMLLKTLNTIFLI